MMSETRRPLRQVRRCHRHTTVAEALYRKEAINVKLLGMMLANVITEKGKNPKRQRDSLRARPQLCNKRKGREKGDQSTDGKGKREAKENCHPRRHGVDEHDATIKSQGMDSTQGGSVRREKRTTPVPLTRRSLATRATRGHT